MLKQYVLLPDAPLHSVHGRQADPAVGAASRVVIRQAAELHVHRAKVFIDIDVVYPRGGVPDLQDEARRRLVPQVALQQPHAAHDRPRGRGNAHPRRAQLMRSACNAVAATRPPHAARRERLWRRPRRRHVQVNRGVGRRGVAAAVGTCGDGRGGSNWRRAIDIRVHFQLEDNPSAIDHLLWEQAPERSAAAGVHLPARQIVPRARVQVREDGLVLEGAAVPRLDHHRRGPGIGGLQQAQAAHLAGHLDVEL
mmetsp:Transcript_40633/g.130756  ORF Transcript_40633/g.130756 Transcript_40633/m.130756 type:complete len:252 (+) Transcript_40633:5877-6632(+)